MVLPDAPAQLSHSMIMAEFGHPANTEWKISADGAAYINFTVGSIIKESDFYSKSAEVIQFSPNIGGGDNWAQVIPPNGGSGQNLVTAWNVTSGFNLPSSTGTTDTLPFTGINIGGNGASDRTVILHTGVRGPRHAFLNQLICYFDTAPTTPVTMTQTDNGNYGARNRLNHLQCQQWFTQNAPADATRIVRVDVQKLSFSSAYGDTPDDPLHWQTNADLWVFGGMSINGLKSGMTTSAQTGNASTADIKVVGYQLAPDSEYTGNAGYSPGFGSILNAGGWQTAQHANTGGPIAGGNFSLPAGQAGVIVGAINIESFGDRAVTWTGYPTSTDVAIPIFTKRDSLGGASFMAVQLFDYTDPPASTTPSIRWTLDVWDSSERNSFGGWIASWFPLA